MFLRRLLCCRARCCVCLDSAFVDADVVVQVVGVVAVVGDNLVEHDVGLVFGAVDVAVEVAMMCRCGCGCCVC